MAIVSLEQKERVSKRNLIYIMVTLMCLGMISFIPFNLEYNLYQALYANFVLMALLILGAVIANRRLLMGSRIVVHTYFIFMMITNTFFGGIYSRSTVMIPGLGVLTLCLLDSEEGIITAIIWTTISTLYASYVPHFTDEFFRLTNEQYFDFLTNSVFLANITALTCGIYFVSMKKSILLKILEEKKHVQDLLHDREILISTINHDLVNPLSVILGSGVLIDQYRGKLQRTEVSQAEYLIRVDKYFDKNIRSAQRMKSSKSIWISLKHLFPLVPNVIQKRALPGRCLNWC